MKRNSFLTALLAVMFFVPSCIGISTGDDPDEQTNEEEEEVIEDENEEATSNWKFLGEINREDAGWGFYLHQNIEVDSDGKIFVLYEPQYSSQGGGQGYAAVITDSAQYNIEVFSNGATAIRTVMYKNTLYAGFVYTIDGKTKIKIAKRENGNWSFINSEIVSACCDTEFGLAAGPDGSLYIAYTEIPDIFTPSGRLTVKKHSSGSWQTLGSIKSSEGNTAELQIAVGNDSHPYVYYQELYNDGTRSTGKVYNFNGSSWSNCADEISSSIKISSVSLNVTGSTAYIAFSERDTSKSYIKYWNGNAWKEAGNSLPFMLQTRLQTFNGELYAGYRNNDDSNYIYISKLKGSKWESIDTEGIKDNVATSTEYFDFRVIAKGIYLLDTSVSRVVYYPF